MTKPETVADVMADLKILVDSDALERVYARLESALAASAEPVACIDERHLRLLRQSFSTGNTLKHPKDAGAGDVLLYTHAQPAAPQSVPTESLGREADDTSTRWMDDAANALACAGHQVHASALATLAEGIRTGRVINAPAPASVPDGWQLVPIEPRLGMLEALSFALFGDARLTFGDRREAFRHGYAAMLAAAPPTNQEGAAP